jgi:hypothetical protein
MSGSMRIPIHASIHWVDIEFQEDDLIIVKLMMHSIELLVFKCCLDNKLVDQFY